MLGTQNLSQKQIEIVKKQVHQEENRATIQRPPWRALIAPWR
jgi:hypothetical protein